MHLHATRKLPLGLLALALPLVGCASVPGGPSAPRTGEPLSVRERTQTDFVNERVKVGEVEHKDANGQTYAKSDVYQNQTRMVQYQVWSSYQGDSKIADDDLYRIADDREAVAEVQDRRESGVTMNHVGLGMLAAGIAGVVGGYVIMSKNNPDSPSPTGTYVMLGSTTIAGIGGILTWLGASKAHAEHPLEQSRAEAAAARYNRALRGGAPVTTTGASYAR